MCGVKGELKPLAHSQAAWVWGKNVEMAFLLFLVLPVAVVVIIPKRKEYVGVSVLMTKDVILLIQHFYATVILLSESSVGVATPLICLTLIMKKAAGGYSFSSSNAFQSCAISTTTLF